MKRLISKKEFGLILSLSLLFSAIALLSGQNGLRETAFPSIVPGHRLILPLILGSGVIMAAVAAAFIYAVRTFRRGFASEILRQARLVLREASAFIDWIKSEADAEGMLLSLLFITAVGAAVRAYFLSQPMRYDEAFTFMNFVRDPRDVFFYRLPNNHVLHTVLVRISVSLFGSGPAAARLPSFLAGVSVIPAVFYLSRIITGNPRAGLLSAGIAAVLPYNVLFDTMARGYSLVVLFSLCLAGLALRFSAYPSRQLSFLISLTTALGLFTMPSFIFAASGIMFWLVFAAARGGRGFLNFIKKHLVHGILTTAALTFLLYLPVIIKSSGIHNITGNRHVQSVPLQHFFDALPGHLSHTFNEFSRDIPRTLIAAAGALFVSGALLFVRKKNFKAAALLPSLAAGGTAALFAVRAIPFPRTWIYLLPFIIIFIDAGFSGVIKIRTKVSAAVVVIFTIWSGFMITSQNMISAYPETGRFPEAAAIADMIACQIGEDDELRVDCPADAPVYYYLWRRGARFKKSWMTSNPRKTYFVVKPSVYTYPDTAGKDVMELFKSDDAGLYLRVND